MRGRWSQKMAQETPRKAVVVGRAGLFVNIGARIRLALFAMESRTKRMQKPSIFAAGLQVLRF